MYKPKHTNKWVELNKKQYATQIKALKEIINGFDESNDYDSPKTQLKTKTSIPEMRKKLEESGYIEESKLKGIELKTKYNELFHD